MNRDRGADRSRAREAGIEALYRKKSTTRRNPEHPVFPYLLRNLTIERPNHVWCADISVLQEHRKRFIVS
ncbi:MAG: hypothetical protein GIX03_01110 [Candidatus Eremiobacteraeota bacterium]|nr:hypothetical protein [Candidatus Eremiobacteraeota bacterium]